MFVLIEILNGHLQIWCLKDKSTCENRFLTLLKSYNPNLSKEELSEYLLDWQYGEDEYLLEIREVEIQ